MTLIIGGLDISAYVMQEVDIEEAPSYIDGQNAGVSKVGTLIFDRVHTRYAFSVPLKPLPQTVYQQILSKCEANKMTVQYTSVRSTSTIAMTAQCSLSGVKYATSVNGTRIYYGAVITVQGA